MLCVRDKIHVTDTHVIHKPCQFPHALTSRVQFDLIQYGSFSKHFALTVDNTILPLMCVRTVWILEHASLHTAATV